MTGSDSSYVLCAILSRISDENVGNQLNFSRIFLLITIIRLSRISAEISFQTS